VKLFRRDLAYTHLESPIGPLLLAGDGEALHLISFPEGKRARRPLESWRHDPSAFVGPSAQIDAYFAGRLREFDLPLVFNGTEFQKSVWTALRTVPFGAVASYGAIARSIGRPTASRAVGAANGANPLPIVVPCHRVIGSTGGLTGFGGGMETKRFLLDHEAGGGLLPALAVHASAMAVDGVPRAATS
jgi:methylated-DNA-[protein]-cysteine S-methyltransferase